MYSQTTPGTSVKLLSLFVALSCISCIFVQPAQTQEPITAGYRDFDFGGDVTDEPTSEKPESKLWWNDGQWWGCMWNPAAERYEIHRFGRTAQSWTSTGTAIDDRRDTKADALWDGEKLYVASHIWERDLPGPAEAQRSARLYRYSYDANQDRYSLDPGFPVLINRAISRALVIDKDSTGKLWATWIQDGRVMVNRSTTDDLSWGSPFQLRVQGNNTRLDGLASVAAFGGNKIGIIWSNRYDDRIYFAVHIDGKSDTDWEDREVALGDAIGSSLADNHINLATADDGSGEVYAVTKTSLNEPDEPLSYFLKRDGNGSWTRSVVGTYRYGYTRPVLLIHRDERRAYVFAVSDNNNNGYDAIYMKSASLDDLEFPTGIGTPFILSATNLKINNPTVTKQCVTNASGLLVLASDKNTNDYFHNYIHFGNQPVVSAFSPATGSVGTQVIIDGGSFVDVTSVAFGGTPTNDYTVLSNNRIIATVPEGASTGPIAVSNPDGTGLSSQEFAIPAPPTFKSFTPDMGAVGNQVTIRGSGFSNLTAVLFNNTPATEITIDSDLRMKVLVPYGATSGPITITNTLGTVITPESFIVTLPPTNHTFTAVADAHVRTDHPFDNYGTKDQIEIKKDGSKYSNGYIKFAVSGIGDIVTSATVRLNVDNDSKGPCHLYPVSSDWNERTITWNNAPPIPGTPLDSTEPIDEDLWAEFDVTSLVQSNGTYSFALTTDSKDNWKFFSKEKRPAPELVIQTMAMQAPRVTSFTPESGEPGAIVTIAGSNFSNITAVDFNGATADFKILSATQLQATLPAEATTGRIHVSSPDGTGTSLSDFVVLRAPQITGFTPTSGPAGTEVRIAGIAFTGATGVSFNNVPATRFTIDSDTQIRATIADGTTTGPIRIATPLGTATSSGVFTIIVPVGIFTFTPSSGPVGTEVTISGLNLANVTSVAFNGTEANFSLQSDGRLLAIVPAGATTGMIRIQSDDDSATSSGRFTVLAAPVISSFTPSSGLPGTQVTVQGSGFTSASEVLFNVTSAAEMTILSDYMLTVRVPEGATTGPITIINPLGSVISNEAFTVTIPPSTSTFTTIADAFIRSDHPNENTGDKDDIEIKTESDKFRIGYFKFDITGIAGRVTSATVRLKVRDESDRGCRIYPVGSNWTEKTITWKIAPPITGEPLSSIGPVKKEQWAELDVTTAISGNGTYSFAVMALSNNNWKFFSKEKRPAAELVVHTTALQPPQITSFTPESGDFGTELTITGSRFSDVVHVDFNGTPANFKVLADTQMIATVPDGATTGRLHVRSPDGTATSLSDFSLIRPPTIASFTPMSGLLGTEVTVQGTAFTSVNAVSFNGAAAAQFQIDSDTQLRATVAEGTTTGPIRVTNSSGAATSTEPFTLLTPLEILTFEPASGAAGTEVSITGRNLTDVTSVLFQGTEASFTVVSDTLLLAIVPENASSGPIQISSADGHSTSNASFTILLPPQIASFAPTWGPAGTRVTMLGSGFTGTTAVQFNGIPATDFVADSDSMIQVAVPADASTGAITVTNPIDSDTTSTEFEVMLVTAMDITASFDHSSNVNRQAAILAELRASGLPVRRLGDWTTSMEATPASSVAEGDNRLLVLITGMEHDLDNRISAVTYGGQAMRPAVQIITSANEYRSMVEMWFLDEDGIEAATNDRLLISRSAGDPYDVLHAMATFANVDQSNPIGATAAAERSGLSSSLDPIDVTAAGVPNTSLTLAAATCGNPGSFVQAANSNCTEVVDLTAASSSMSIAEHAAASILELPQITGFTPLGGPIGTEVLIEGGNLGHVTAVEFGGTPVAAFDIDSDGQLRAAVPEGATTGRISLINEAGVAKSVTDFVVTNETGGGGTGTIVNEGTILGASSALASVSTAAPVLGVSDDLYLTAISAKGNTEVLSVVGLGLQWTKVRAQCAGRNQTGVDVWMAQGTPTSNGIVTADLAEAPSNAVIAVTRYSGVASSDPIGNVVSGNSNGVDGICSGGIDSNSYALELHTTSNAALVYSAIALRSRHNTPGTGFTELIDFNHGLPGTEVGLAVQERSIATPETLLVDGTINRNVDWAVIGLEIKPGPATAPGSEAKPTMEEPVDEVALLPSQTRLFQNAPNPFRPSTLIRFNMARAGHVKIKIFDVKGRLVKTLADGQRQPGRHQITWHGDDNRGRSVAPGVYFYRMVAPEFTKTRRLLRIK